MSNLNIVDRIGQLKPSIFAELLKAITLETMFSAYVRDGGTGGKLEMWNRLCRRTGAPDKQV